MKNKMLLLMSLSISCILVFSLNAFALTSESPPVSLEIAKFIALDTAKQFYKKSGELEVYDAEPYYDLDGQVTVYAITLKKKGLDVSALENIDDVIIDQYNQIELLEEQISKIKGENISGKKKSEKIKNTQKEISTKIKSLMGTEDFITVICSANESKVPVLKLFKGLPEHKTQIPALLRKEEVKQSIVGEKVKRTYFLGMFDLGFEFGETFDSPQVNMGNHQIDIPSDTELVHSRSGKIFTKEQFKQMRKQKKLSSPAAASENKQNLSSEALGKKWDRIKSRFDQSIREQALQTGSVE